VTVGTDGVLAETRERRSPGLAALFDALRADGRHAILDLGPASAAHLRVLGPFASQIRFAGLLSAAGRGAGWEESVRGLPPNPGRPYDVVLAWDVLDRMEVRERSPLLERLAGVTAEGARLHVITGSETVTRAPDLGFTLLDRERVSERPSCVTEMPRRPLLPAEMERVLAPFEVVSGFILKTGAREYVAKKRP
jgi:hypothetical protein